MNSGPLSTIWARRRLVLGRRLTVGFVGVLTLTFLGGLALFGVFDMDALAVWDVPDGIRIAAVEAGWSIRSVTVYLLALELVCATIGIATALLVLRGADTWFRIFAGGTLALYATTGGLVPLVYDRVLDTDAGALVQGIAWIAVFQLAYLLPNGRFMPRWTRVLPVAWSVFLLASVAAGVLGVPANTVPESIVLMALVGITVAASISRFARVSDELERLQTAWVVAAFGARLLVSGILFAVPVTRAETDGGVAAFATFMAIVSLSYAVAAILPLAVAVAVALHGLFDVNLWLNRGLMYATLTALVFGVYASVVTLVGFIWPGGAGPIPLIVAVVAVIAVSSVRGWIQRAVNRLVYGQRREPHSVIADLGDRLNSARTLDAIISTIVDTLGTTLRLRYVRLRVDVPSRAEASFGTPEDAAPHVSFALRHDDREFGELQVATRIGDRLGDQDLTLLRGLTSQVEGALHAAAVTEELRQTHEQLVDSVERERVRLHRDLHDGLGPSLASIYQQLDAARALIPTRASAADSLLSTAAATARSVLTEIRRLVFELHPPDLQERGLVGAIEETCRRLVLPHARPSVRIDARALPALPPDVEVALYRIASEAVTNVVRHAEASEAQITLSASAGKVLLVVTDDGVGVPGTGGTGTGLDSMRARARRLGGTVAVTSDVGHGTIVRAELPLRMVEASGEPT